MSHHGGEVVGKLQLLLSERCRGLRFKPVQIYNPLDISSEIWPDYSNTTPALERRKQWETGFSLSRVDIKKWELVTTRVESTFRWGPQSRHILAASNVLPWCNKYNSDGNQTGYPENYLQSHTLSFHSLYWTASSSRHVMLATLASHGDGRFGTWGGNPTVTFKTVLKTACQYFK